MLRYCLYRASYALLSRLVRVVLLLVLLPYLPAIARAVVVALWRALLAS